MNFKNVSKMNKFLNLNKFKYFILFSLVFSSEVVYAYAGPGVALGVVVVVITVFFAFFASIFISLFNLLKKLFFKIKKISNKKSSPKNK